MVAFKDVKAYMDNLYETDKFDKLDEDEQEKVVFSADEMLQDFYKKRHITERVVALQVLHMLGGASADDFTSLKRQGVESYSVKGVSVSFGESAIQKAYFNGDAIAPAVKNILGEGGKGTAQVSELI